jgi:hypothetical protein
MFEQSGEHTANFDRGRWIDNEKECPCRRLILVKILIL